MAIGENFDAWIILTNGGKAQNALAVLFAQMEIGGDKDKIFLGCIPIAWATWG